VGVRLGHFAIPPPSPHTSAAAAAVSAAATAVAASASHVAAGAAHLTGLAAREAPAPVAATAAAYHHATAAAASLHRPHTAAAVDAAVAATTSPIGSPLAMTRHLIHWRVLALCTIVGVTVGILQLSQRDMPTDLKLGHSKIRQNLPAVGCSILGKAPWHILL
jgi:uncharacterized membrane protein YfcA